MNLFIVPKYKKYNSALDHVCIAMVPRVERPNVVVERPKDPLPVPIYIDKYKYKPKKSVHVRIRDSLSHWYPRKSQTYEKSVKQPKKLGKQNKKQDEFGLKTKKKVSSWYMKRKALKAIQADNKKEIQRLKKWEKWKQKEQAIIQKAQLEKAREDREKEYLHQMIEIEKAKAKLAKDTLKTKYPYKVERKPVIETNPYLESDAKEIDRQYEQYQNNYETSPDYYSKPVKIKKVKKEKPKKVKKVKEVKPKVKKEKKVKAKVEKPPKEKKFKETPVMTKRESKKPGDNINVKFVNCCYRICCQFYCWLSVFILITIIILMFV